ncbi:MAG: hypothetical protein QOH69_1917 [Actinomycetota bacterium]|jgi:hypothetical protein|nr:hypothetical protein [Actinomycetota bacterium]
MMRPVALAVGFAVLLMAIPANGTGATWTTTTTATTAAAGTGQWCAAPDPSEVGARFIRLSTVTTNVGTNQQMAIIPVANNAAWGGGTGVKTLNVRLWGCQTAPVGSLRVTAWSNPSTALGMTWLAGGAVAPASRLNPASAAGIDLKTRAQLATVTGAPPPLLGSPSGDVRRYSWIIAGGRTNASSAAEATDPPQCTYFTNLLGSAACPVDITNSLGGDSAFANLFNVTPWSGSTISSVTYTAHTWATQSATGWGTANGWLNVTCGVLALLECGTNVTTTFLNGTSASDASLLASSNGNLLQWVVVQWTGTTPPPSDLVLEVFLQ